MINALFSLDAPTWGVTDDHVPGLKALLLSPFLVLLIVRTLHVAGHLNVPGLARVAARYRAAPLTLRVVTWLMVTSGLVHLALLPHHIQDGETGTAWLFGIDVAVLFGAAFMIPRSRRWRLLAIGVLVGNLGFYLGYTGSHREPVDQLGVATKTLELLALGFLLYPHRRTIDLPIRRRRWVGAATGFLLLFSMTGAAIWGVMLNPAAAESESGASAHTHGDARATTNHHEDDPTMKLVGDTTTPPTQAQSAAAAKLATDTRAAIAKYEDVDVALAEGYKPDGEALDFAVHYTNKKRENDGKILDPDAPETLVYSDTSFGPPVLLGVMYSMPGLQRDAPAPGGSLTVWHLHTNICMSPIPPFFVGVVSPFGACTAGSLSVTSGAMIHIWTVDWAGGPYGEMTENDAKPIIARLQQGGDRRSRMMPSRRSGGFPDSSEALEMTG